MHKYLVSSVFVVSAMVPLSGGAADNEADRWNLKDLYASQLDWWQEQLADTW